MDTGKRHKAEFVRALSRLDATAIVVGSMIGSGIFIVSADIVRQVRAPGLLLLIWVVSGILTLLGALAFGELSAMYPKAGGQYVYLREGISPLFGYLYGWTLFLVIQSGAIAAVAVAFARFVSIFVPALSPDVGLGFTLPLPSGPIRVGLSPQRVLAIASIGVLTWVNARGVRTAAVVQTSLAAIKIAALAGLIVLGLGIGRRPDALVANFGPSFWPDGGLTWALVPVVAAAMIGALFSMDAWNNAGFVASEVKNPKRDVPFAMTAGVLLVTSLYLLANVSYLAILPADAIAAAPQDRVGTAALGALLGELGQTLMAAAIIVSTFGCNAALILAGARVYYAMAQDGLFFKSAGTLHPRRKTPTTALIAQSAWASVLCLSGTYAELLDYVMFASLLFYVLTIAGLFVLRIKRPDAERPVRAPGYPWLPAVYMVLTGLIVVGLLWTRPQYTWPGLVIVTMGVPAYFAWKRSARRTGTAEADR